MIRISGIGYGIEKKEEDLRDCVAARYGLRDISYFEISKKSVDARRKNDVKYVFSVDVCCADEKKLIKRYRNISEYVKKEYVFPGGTKKDKPIVIVGFGPAGMMCALTLVRNGYRVIVAERGKRVEERIRDVERLRENGILEPVWNVLFGVGGAGTFSDGKLNTGINDGRINAVFEEFYKHGAPKEILYLAKPHIGTDNLCETVKNIRNDIINCGGEIMFSSRLTDIETENGRVSAAVINGCTRIETNHIVLATGHSARDIFLLMKKMGIKMERKTFSVGVRIEHKQEDINRAQYGEAHKYLGAADYKLNVKTEEGRGVYTFCMCPGGEVVASASEEGGVVTNGMSRFARDGENANSALLVNVYPEDFEGDDVLAGMYFQRETERRGFVCGGGDYRAVCETVGHLMGGENVTDIIPTYKPGVKFSAISDVLPDFAVRAIKEALPKLDKKLRGFAAANAVMTVPETRSSSPVRIIRSGETLEAIRGLFPCGEGAGYAGGITSAAVDGIRVAEAVAKF